MVNYIVDEIKKLPPLISMSPTAPKHTIIKQCLIKAVSAVPEGTKLPTLRELSVLFQATSHPVQRAINALTEEGILRSKSRSGIFVGNTKALIRQQTYHHDLHPVREIKLYLGNLTVCQRKFWEKSIESFEKEHRFIRIKLTASKSDKTGSDLFEARFPQFNFYKNLLLLSGYFESDFKPIASYFMPIYLLTPVIIFNTDILSKLGLTIPVFKSFNQQITFFRKASRTAKARNVPCRFINNLQLVVWLGTLRNDIISLVRGNGKNSLSLSDLETKIDRLLDIVQFLNKEKSLSIEPGIDPLDPFVSGEVVAHIGWSYQTEIIKARKVDFTFKATPFLSCDNNIFGFPFTLAVAQDTRHPVECVRFLKHLLSPACQEMITETIGESIISSISKKLPEGERLSEPSIVQDDYDDRDDIYLRYSIINDELWRAIDVGYRGKEALGKMINLGLSYLKAKEMEKNRSA